MVSSVTKAALRIARLQYVSLVRLILESLCPFLVPSQSQRGEVVSWLLSGR